MSRYLKVIGILSLVFLISVFLTECPAPGGDPNRRQTDGDNYHFNCGNRHVDAYEYNPALFYRCRRFGMEILDANVSGVDETLKHLIVTYTSITNTGGFVAYENPADFFYALYARSGYMLTIEGNTKNVAHSRRLLAVAH